MIRISLVEQAVRTDYFLGQMAGWRNYRIEYVHEGSEPEGIIWLPPGVDPWAVEKILEDLLNENSS